MKRPVLRNLRARLLLLVFVVLLPSLALTVWTGLEQRRLARAFVEEQALQFAEVIAEEQEELLLHEPFQILRLLAAAPPVQRQNRAACNAWLRQLIKLYPRYVEFGAATGTGQVFCHAGRVAVPPSIAERASFRDALVLHSFAVGDGQRSEVRRPSVIDFAHPILDAQGVVFAAVDLSSNPVMPPEVSSPVGAVIVVTDRAGHVLARLPTAGPRDGIDHNPVLIGRIIGGRAGVTETREPDGPPRIVGFAPVHGLDGLAYAHVSVSFPHDVAYAEPNRLLTRNVLALGIVGLLALGLAWVGADWLVLRRVRTLIAATKHVAVGDFRARTGLAAAGGEIGELSEAFDAMAAALEGRATATARAEDALRASEAKLMREHAFLMAVLNTADALVLVLDRQGQILQCNRACERTTGYQADEVRGRLFSDVFEQPDEAPLDAVVSGLERANPPYRFETHAVARDECSRVIAWANTAMFDAWGTVEYIIATGTDITERKDAEAELRRSEATARAFLESAGEGILVIDRDGRILFANTRLATLFGYDRHELLGQSCDVLVPERYRAVHGQRCAAFFDAPRAGRASIQSDLPARRKDGSEFPVEISVSFIETDEGPRLMAFVLDLTERLALRRLAEQSEKLAALGTLAAGIAHEVNNPIGTIVSRVQLMLMDVEALSPTMAADLQVIQRHAQRVARIANAMLSFARQSPVSPESMVTMQLNRVVEETVVLVEDQLAKDGIGLHSTLAPDLPPMSGDMNALEQVLVNLVTNARQAMPGGGTIRVETRLASERPGWLSLVVSDSGHGIAAEVVPKIFEPFFTTKARGTGLGLSVSYGIVRDHGGVIEVESVIGRGTTFTVSFPTRHTLASLEAPATAAAQHGETAEAPPGPRSSGLEAKRTPDARPAPGPPRHILLIEDDADTREALRQLLEFEGHRVDVAGDGREAVAVVLRTKPEIALIDIGLPGLNGYQVARTVRMSLEGPQIYLIALTGYPEDEARAREAGFDRHIRKPIDASELGRAIASATASLGQEANPAPASRNALGGSGCPCC